MLGDCLHRPSRNFMVITRACEGGMSIMSVDRHIRLTDEQASRLRALSSKTGYSDNAIVRMLIDNIDDVTMSKLRTLTKHDDLLLANAKYNAMLRKNIATNINTIAKYVNGRNVNDDALRNAFEVVKSQLNEVESEMTRHYASFKNNKQ